MSRSQTSQDAGIDAIIAEVFKLRLTYLNPKKLRDLADTVLQTEQRGTPGAIVEAGTALGGSAIVMAAAKARSRPMKVYDAFSMIPPPSDKDGEDVHRRYKKIASGSSNGIRGDVYYGYRQDLLAEVTQSFARFGLPVAESNVQLIKGYFENTMDIDYPVAVAHLDGDWYESTMTCLQRLVPNLVPGGRLVIDDYDTWSGCTRAVDEFFAGRDDFEFMRKSRLHIVRRGGRPGKLRSLAGRAARRLSRLSGRHAGR